MDTPAATPPATKASSVWGWAALVLGAVWISSLLLLVIRTANPVTVNQAQLNESFAVISARVISIDPGEVEVLEVLLGDFDRNMISVRNLRETPAQVGEMYFLPIIPAIEQERLIDDMFDITPSPLPNPVAQTPHGLPIIYPATDAARTLLQDASQ